MFTGHPRVKSRVCLKVTYFNSWNPQHLNVNELSQRRIKGKSMNTMASRRKGGFCGAHGGFFAGHEVLWIEFNMSHVEKYESIWEIYWINGQWYFTKLDLIQMLGHLE